MKIKSKCLILYFNNNFQLINFTCVKGEMTNI